VLGQAGREPCRALAAQAQALPGYGDLRRRGMCAMPGPPCTQSALRGRLRRPLRSRPRRRSSTSLSLAGTGFCFVRGKFGVKRKMRTDAENFLSSFLVLRSFALELRGL
jgi:hypothetical protein